VDVDLVVNVDLVVVAVVLLDATYFAPFLNPFSNFLGALEGGNGKPKKSSPSIE
jgi:hypothetical protein